MPSASDYGYWKYNGTNGLKGNASTFVTLPDGRVVTVKDPDNPAILEDIFIADILRTSRQGRIDFCRLFPTLTDGEQDRLTTLILQNPRATSLLRDSQDFHDAVQNKQVTADIRLRIATRVPQIAVDNRLEVS